VHRLFLKSLHQFPADSLPVVVFPHEQTGQAFLSTPQHAHDLPIIHCHQQDRRTNDLPNGLPVSFILRPGMLEGTQKRTSFFLW
jgi:hypothetical protein